jgi:hypothetical protein
MIIDVGEILRPMAEDNLVFLLRREIGDGDKRLGIRE